MLMPFNIDHILHQNANPNFKKHGEDSSAPKAD